MRKNMSQRFKISIALMVALIVVIAICVTFFAFVWSSICGDCGLQRDSVRYLGCLTFHDVKATPLSLYANAELVDPNHPHQWLFGQGSGGGVTCAIGPGRHIRRFTNEESLIRFLKHIKTYQGIDEAQMWLGRFLNPDQNFDVSIMLNDMPEDGTAFGDWYAEQVKKYEILKKTQK